MKHSQNGEMNVATRTEKKQKKKKQQKNTQINMKTQNIKSHEYVKHNLEFVSNKSDDCYIAQ